MARYRIRKRNTIIFKHVYVVNGEPAIDGFVVWHGILGEAVKAKRHLIQLDHERANRERKESQ